MTIGAVVSLVLWVVTILGFVVWNLYQKNKKMEDILELQQFYIASVLSVSADLDAVINKMDTTMWVQSDPELVQLFENVKTINSTIKRISQQNGN